MRRKGHLLHGARPLTTVFGNRINYTMLRLLLIRHGECEMNLSLADRIGGRSNESPLTDRGISQAVSLSRFLDYHLQHCSPIFFSSTAVRTIETARAALQVLGKDVSFHSVHNAQEAIDTVVNVFTSERLLEIDMGEFEGKLRSECYTKSTLELIEQDTHNFAPPGGESQCDVEERMASFIENTVLPLLSDSRPAIIFGHGMAIKCFLRRILGSDAKMTRRITLDNTSVTEVGFVPRGNGNGHQSGWHIVRVNDTRHL